MSLLAEPKGNVGLSCYWQGSYLLARVVTDRQIRGFIISPGPLNPYEQFNRLAPTEVIQHGVFVFDGHFDVPLASAISHIQEAQNLLAAKQIELALAEAQSAVRLAPNAVDVQLTVGNVLAETGQAAEARSTYEKPLLLAKTIEPEFQIRSIPNIERKLGSQK